MEHISIIILRATTPLRTIILPLSSYWKTLLLNFEYLPMALKYISFCLWFRVLKYLLLIFKNQEICVHNFTTIGSMY